MKTLFSDLQQTLFLLINLKKDNNKEQQTDDDDDDDDSTIKLTLFTFLFKMLKKIIF
jgi:hypothetical protein